MICKEKNELNYLKSMKIVNIYVSLGEGGSNWFHNNTQELGHLRKNTCTASSQPLVRLMPNPLGRKLGFHHLWIISDSTHRHNPAQYFFAPEGIKPVMLTSHT